ncbi:hypothetical protein B14911_26845 [Bacillus sp. NRRL B-14911]|nr:hypothetical protein B14911_26845 [Bacillus sp. NRRL B-14911]
MAYSENILYFFTILKNLPAKTAERNGLCLSFRYTGGIGTVSTDLLPRLHRASPSASLDK